MQVDKAAVRQLRKSDLVWAITNRCKHGKLYIEHLECLEDQSPKEKTGFFDIEASNLKADFGILLSYCIKELDGKIHRGLITPEQLRSTTQDRNLVRQCVADLQGFDRIVTYYGARYDIPFIRSRALYNGVTFPKFGAFYHTDVYDWVKRKLKLHGNRMQFACDFLDIPSKEHKLIGAVWNRALTGSKKDLQFILQHNMEDVISLEQLWKTLLPFVKIVNSNV